MAGCRVCKQPVGNCPEFRYLGGMWVMEWYWWVLIALVIIVLIKFAFSGKKPEPPRTDELDAIFQKSRNEGAAADRELA